MDDLKPCPFCGGTNLRGPHDSTIGDCMDVWWWVECEDCPGFMEVEGEPDILIAAWNRRDPSTRNEAIEECLEIMRVGAKAGVSLEECEALIRALKEGGE